MNNMQVINTNYHIQANKTQNIASQQSNSKIQLTYVQNNGYLSSKTAYQTTSNMPLYQPKIINQESIVRKQYKNVHSQERQSSLPVNNNIYLLMKEQIDIAAFNYREKMNKILQQQAKQIHNLTHTIMRHKQIINRQAQIISGIKRIDDKSTKSRYSPTGTRENSKINSKSPVKISLTQRKIATKQTSPFKEPNNQDTQSRLLYLKNQIEQLDKRLKQGMTYSKQVMYKLIKVQDILKSDINAKLLRFEQRLSISLKSNEQKLNKMQIKVDNKIFDTNTIKNKNQFLQDEIEELKRLTHSIKNRQYKYDSYHLKLLQKQIVQIQLKIQQLSQYKRSDNYQMKIVQPHEPSYIDDFDRPQQSYLQLMSINSVNHSTKISRRHSKLDPVNYLQVSQLSSMTHYSPKYKERKDQQRININKEWQMQIDDNQSSFSQENDQFFYPEEENSQQIIQDRLSRFKKVLIKQFKELPVQVQIDQTGYIKFCDSGMYILDENGDGFDLDDQEINYLKSKGIIKF